MNLKRILEEKGIKQGEFAKMVGKTRTAVNQYCNGVLVPSMESVMKMCEVLNVQPGDLLDEKSVIRLQVDLKLNEMAEGELARLLGELYK